MVVPDRVVQAQGLVPASPLVAGARVLVDDERRHPELAQPGAEGDAALAAADDQDVGLDGDAELRLLLLAAFQPASCRSLRAPCSTPSGRAAPRASSYPLSSVRVVSIVQAFGPSSSVSRSSPRPRPTPVSKVNHAGDHAVRLGRFLLEREAARVGALERAAEQVGDSVGVLDGRDVPGERHEVTPEAGRGEHPGRTIDVAGAQRRPRSPSARPWPVLPGCRRRCRNRARWSGSWWCPPSTLCEAGHTPRPHAGQGCKGLQRPPPVGRSARGPRRARTRTQPGRGPVRRGRRGAAAR